MSIIEKLGIRHLERFNVDAPVSGVHKMCKDIYVQALENQRDEMLEALINSCHTFERYTEIHYKKHGVGNEKYARNKYKFDYLKNIIEEATGKTWEEVKALL